MSEQIKNEFENLYSQLESLATQKGDGWEEAYTQKYEQLEAFVQENGEALETLLTTPMSKIKEAILEKAIKDLTPDEQEKEKDRLNAIPSELEAVLYLASKDKTIFAIGGSYAEWLNVYNGIDIPFMDKEDPPPGYTNLAGVDVKNPKKTYPNFIVETEKKYGGNWYEKYAWAQHVREGKNRYIAYVRGGKEYGGRKATETAAFNPDLSEEENKAAILTYFFERQDLLNHTIEIIRGEDMKAYLDKNGNGNLLPGYTDTKGHLIPKEQWIHEYNYPVLSVTKDGSGWKEIQLNPQNPLIIQTDREKTDADIQETITRQRAFQANGMTLPILKRLFGLPLTWEELPRKSR